MASLYPFCVDCKHCRTADEVREQLTENDFRPIAGSDALWCINSVNVVTGKPELCHCSLARSYRIPRPGDINAPCGLDGCLFEVKETE